MIDFLKFNINEKKACRTSNHDSNINRPMHVINSVLVTNDKRQQTARYLTHKNNLFAQLNICTHVNFTFKNKEQRKKKEMAPPVKFHKNQ